MDDLFRFADELGPLKLVHIWRPILGLKAIVALDNIACGPAIGGVRMALITLKDKGRPLFDCPRGRQLDRDAVIDVAISGSRRRDPMSFMLRMSGACGPNSWRKAPTSPAIRQHQDAALRERRFRFRPAASSAPRWNMRAAAKPKPSSPSIRRSAPTPAPPRSG